MLAAASPERGERWTTFIRRKPGVPWGQVIYPLSVCETTKLKSAEGCSDPTNDVKPLRETNCLKMQMGSVNAVGK